MFQRTLALAVLFGATAFVYAQSAASFEMYGVNTWSVAPTYAIVGGDFQNAGRQDVVYVGNPQSQTVLTMLAGNGDGTFQAPQTVATPTTFTNDLAVADVNGDGHLDLIAAVSSNDIEVFYGNGNGTFQAAVTYPTAADPDSIAVGNFFNDGYTDVAVGDANGNVELFKNVGGKSLVLTSTVDIGNGASGSVATIRAGDLNGDGLTDLGVLVKDGSSSNPYAGTVYAVWNLGNGSFSVDNLANYDSPLALNVGAANSSGLADIVATYYCDPSVPLGTSQTAACTGIDIFSGTGSQTLTQRTAVTDPPDLAGAVWPVDVNGDGIIDLVSTGYHEQVGGNAGLMVWLGNADGTFQQTPQYFFSDTDNAGAIVPGDWARNGTTGFVMMWGAGTEVYLNASDRTTCGTYTVSPSVTVCQPVNNTYSPSPVTVEANGYDSTQMTAMQEYIDGTLEYSKPVTSFDTAFPLNPGAHLLVTKGWDAKGASFMVGRTITVYNGTPYPACAAAEDSASICLPSSATSSSPVHILANGATDLIPTAAQLYINGSLVVNNQGPCYSTGYCQGGTSYVDTTQTLSSGTYDLVFKLWDTEGNVYQAQKTITVQ